MAKKEKWNDNQIISEAAKFFTQTESNLIFRRDADQADFEPKLNAIIQSLGLPREELGRIDQYKATIFQRLPNKIVPVGTRVIISNYYTENDEKSYGTFSLLLPGQSPLPVYTVPGSYFEKAKQKNIKENPLALSEILKRIKTN